jgi:type II restriction enzyme
MAEKHRLRRNRLGTIINETSKKQEEDLTLAISSVQDLLRKKFPGIRLRHDANLKLVSIIASLKKSFPAIDFHSCFESSSMRPDGGVLYVVGKNGVTYPILIAEKKNQGTNDLRVQEGKGKQAKGNAIERLGKNVIGFRTALLNEGIFPFVCFGDGCDFNPESSILDRVVTIAMFGKLNVEYLHNLGPQGVFNRGTFYFREAQWTAYEMTQRSMSIAEKSVFYYFSKYGQAAFI